MPNTRKKIVFGDVVPRFIGIRVLLFILLFYFNFFGFESLANFSYFWNFFGSSVNMTNFAKYFGKKNGKKNTPTYTQTP